MQHAPVAKSGGAGAVNGSGVPSSGIVVAGEGKGVDGVSPPGVSADDEETAGAVGKGPSGTTADGAVSTSARSASESGPRLSRVNGDGDSKSSLVDSECDGGEEEDGAVAAGGSAVDVDGLAGGTAATEARLYFYVFSGESIERDEPCWLYYARPAASLRE